MKRYVRVGRAVGGVAAKVAGNRILGDAVQGTVNAADLRVALGGLKGPLMKVAQILSTVPDLLPEEYSRELIQLQSNAPSMGWPFVRRRMKGELGPDWMGRFETFDRKAVAAASLGQVHRATIADGRSLACKLQYPDMASAVEADLKQLRLVFALYRRYDPAIDPSEFIRSCRIGCAKNWIMNAKSVICGFTSICWPRKTPCMYRRPLTISQRRAS